MTLPFIHINPSTLLRPVAGAVAAVALTGCTVGPDFAPPETTVPLDWVGPTSQPAEAPPTTGPSYATTETTELTYWWMLLDDPVLTSLIERALHNNLDLQLAEARLRQVRASRGVSASNLYPNVNAGGSYTRSDAGSNHGDDNGRDAYRVGFDASWEIDVFGGTRRSIEAADAEIEASVHDQRDVLVSLTAEVAVNYIQLRGLQKQIAIAQSNLDIQKHSAQLTRARQAGGWVSRLDVANADALVASTRAQIPSLRTAEQQTINTLNFLTGTEPGSLQPELLPPAPLPGVPAEIPIGLPSDLLRRRPDIRRAESQLHAATARIGVATADLYPRFSLTGNIGLSGDSSRSLTRIANNIWSIGPSISLPLFNGGRIRSNIRVQQAITDQSLISYRRTVLTALQEVENALIAYHNEQERREILIEAVAANRLALDLANELYSAGSTDFLNVLSAQRSLQSSQDALVQSDRNVITNLISLYKALGGGW